MKDTHSSMLPGNDCFSTNIIVLSKRDRNLGNMAKMSKDSKFHSVPVTMFKNLDLLIWLEAPLVHESHLFFI